MARSQTAFSAGGRTPDRAGGTCVVEAWKGDITPSAPTPRYFRHATVRSTLGDHFVVDVDDGALRFQAAMAADSPYVRRLLTQLIAATGLTCTSVVEIRCTTKPGNKGNCKVLLTNGQTVQFATNEPLAPQVSELTKTMGRMA